MLRSFVLVALTISFGSAHALTFLGCHRDQGDPQGLTGRDLSGSVSSSPTMTGAQCVAECTAKGFAYAGTQYGSYCFCGNGYGRTGPANNCDTPCGGDGRELCGGAWANSVYDAATPAPAGNAQFGSQPALASKLGRRSEGAVIAPTQPPEGAPPIGLTVVAKGPAIATLTWQVPAGPVPTGYDVYRATESSGATVKLTTAPIGVTRFDDTSGGLQYRVSYVYRVVAAYSNGSYGRAEVSFMPPPPQNPDPKSLKTQLQGRNLIVSWAGVPGATSYGIAGDTSADWREVAAPATQVIYQNIANGKHTYAVGAYYDPGRVSTPATEWPRISVGVGGGGPGGYYGGGVVGSGSGSGPSTGGVGSGSGSSGSTTQTGCACKTTGLFRIPAFKVLDDDGLAGTFQHPSDGVFTVAPMATSQPGIVDLSVTDPSGAVVLSVPAIAGWGASPNGRFFVVVGALVGTNAGAPATVYRVAKGLFQSLVPTEVWPDGKWAFSPDSSLFVVTRQQQAPAAYSFEVYNLTAPNPLAAVHRVNEVNSFGNLIAISPCGDRFMYFRWTQLSPQAGQADFYARKDLGRSQTPLVADTPAAAVAPPTANVEAGTAANTFNVKLSGATLRSGATAFPSLQCQ